LNENGYHNFREEEKKEDTAPPVAAVRENISAHEVTFQLEVLDDEDNTTFRMDVEKAPNMFEVRDERAQIEHPFDEYINNGPIGALEVHI